MKEKLELDKVQTQMSILSVAGYAILFQLSGAKEGNTPTEMNPEQKELRLQQLMQNIRTSVRCYQPTNEPIRGSESSEGWLVADELLLLLLMFFVVVVVVALAASSGFC